MALRHAARVAAHALLLPATAYRPAPPAAGLALRSSPFMLLCLAVATLIKRRPDLHARYRELISAGAAAVLVWTMLQLTLGGGLNLFKLHSGSAPELLGAILFSSSAAWLYLHFM